MKNLAHSSQLENAQSKNKIFHRNSSDKHRKREKSENVELLPKRAESIACLFSLRQQ